MYDDFYEWRFDAASAMFILDDARNLMVVPATCPLLSTIENGGENGGIYIFKEVQSEDLRKSHR